MVSKAAYVNVPPTCKWMFFLCRQEFIEWAMEEKCRYSLINYTNDESDVKISCFT